MELPHPLKKNKQLRKIHLLIQHFVILQLRHTYITQRIKEIHSGLINTGPLHLNQDHFPLSQNHIPLSQVQNQTPVIHLIIPVIHLLPNLDFLVKTKVKVLSPSQFAIIVNNQVISFQNV